MSVRTQFLLFLLGLAVVVVAMFRMVASSPCMEHVRECEGIDCVAAMRWCEGGDS